MRACGQEAFGYEAMRYDINGLTVARSRFSKMDIGKDALCNSNR